MLRRCAGSHRRVSATGLRASSGGQRATRSMRPMTMLALLGITFSCTAVSANAGGVYEFEVRTESRMRGTVRLEEKGTVRVKADRLRQEMRGTRTVVTRRGARYQKPTHRVTLDQLDTGPGQSGSRWLLELPDAAPPRCRTDPSFLSNENPLLGIPICRGFAGKVR